MKNQFEKGLPSFSVFEVFDKIKGETVGYFSTKEIAQKFIEVKHIKLYDINELKVNDKKLFERLV